jgi:hypothetical protein
LKRESIGDELRRCRARRGPRPWRTIIVAYQAEPGTTVGSGLLAGLRACSR